MTKSVNTKPVNAKPAFNLVETMVDLAGWQSIKDTASLNLSNANEGIQQAYQTLVANKVVMGKSVRTCAVAQSFKDALESIMVNGKRKYAAGTVTNMISALRLALINKPKVLDLNASQTKARAKAKEANATKGTSTKNGINPKDTKAGKVSVTSAGDKTNQEKIAIMLESILSLSQSDDAPDYDVLELQALVKECLDIVT